MNSGPPDSDLDRAIVTGFRAAYGPSDGMAGFPDRPAAAPPPTRDSSERPVGQDVAQLPHEVVEVVERYRKAGEELGAAAGYVLRGCRAHFAELGIPAGEVEGYFRLQRRVLASLYHEVRETVPSPTAVGRLILRFALDARQPVGTDLRNYPRRERDGRWEIGVYPPGTVVRVFDPPNGYRPVVVPFAECLLASARDGSIDAAAIVALIEGLCDGPPTRSEALEVGGGTQDSIPQSAAGVPREPFETTAPAAPCPEVPVTQEADVGSVATTPHAPTPPVLPDRCAFGVAILVTAHQAKHRITAIELANQMGITRQQLYENKEFRPVREVGIKLFEMFAEKAKKGDYQGPCGSKNQGKVEAREVAEDED